MDTAMYRLPVEYDIEITRAEQRSMASKNCKVQQQKGSRGDNDLCIFRNKWEEIIYVESVYEEHAKSSQDAIQESQA
ncbi:unnamed protein product [Rhizophagus irregularis]|nr:unnamed protein product [Rhizophagus irregularis]